ncbi:MAG: phenylacetate--CoA ligase family protein [Desulfosoma sp.]|uniref:phenylacetate--CoA ligase family protein n=1 Tax=Desulfosoma sp. TaxID=2603217 RepID=UPI00404A511B
MGGLRNGNGEGWSPEERRQQQLEQLQVSCNRAYRSVPFYRNRFQALGLSPQDITSLEDLRRLPFTERRHFIEHYPYGLFAVPLRDIVRIHTAPGAAGGLTVSGYTARDLRVWKDMVARALRAAGVSADDILQIVLHPGLANWGRDYKDGAEALQAGVIPLNALHISKQILVLRDYKTSVLVTTPSSALQLQELLFAADINPNELSLKTLILVGEPAEPAVRRAIEEYLHVTTWQHYGLSEVPGPAVAYECGAHEGLHVAEDHFAVEVLNPETQEPVAEGESGELVLTSLTIQAFPLIRFRTGDLVRVVGRPCPCGRTLLRVEWLPQRVDDLMVIQGVKIQKDQVAVRVAQTVGFAPQRLSVHLVQQGGYKALEVRLGMEEALFSDEIKELEHLVRKTAFELRQEFGVPVEVRLLEGPSVSAPATALDRKSPARL